jgi:hypothetical protein
MGWTGRQRWVLSLLLCSMAAAIGCARKPTPQEMEHAMKWFDEDRSRSPNSPRKESVITSLQCRDGEGDFQLICIIQTEPTPFGLSHGKKPLTRRVGVSNVYWHDGRPFGAHTYLPLEGPVPSRKELKAMRAEEHAKVAAQTKKRLDEVGRPR